MSSQSKQAAIYSSISSDEQEDEGVWSPAQAQQLSDYAGSEKFGVVEDYVDVETAKPTGRSGFDSMVNFVTKEAKSTARESRCRVVFVEKTDGLQATLGNRRRTTLAYLRCRCNAA